MKEKNHYNSERNSVYSKSRHHRRKRRRGAGRFIMISIFICMVLVGAVIGYRILKSNAYDSEDSFKKYSGKVLEEISGEKAAKDMEDKIISYGKPLSVAAIYPKVNDAAMDNTVKEYIDEKRTEFQNKYASESKKEKLGLFIGYSLHKSDMDATSIVFKSLIKRENTEGKMKKINEDVKIFKFNSKNKYPVFSFMVFKQGFQNKLRAMLIERIEKEYGKDIKSNYKNIIYRDRSLSNFAITKEGIEYYFSPNTILNKEDIAPVIKINKSDLSDILNSNINPKKLDPSKPMVAMTFDDGPALMLTDRVINAFKHANGTCTFFQLGQNIKSVGGAKQILKRAEKAGCELASHSWDHPNLKLLSPEKVKEQNEKTDKAFIEAVGYKPVLYRPPFGSADDKITKIFDKSAIYWTVDTLDWKSRNAQSVIAKIKNNDTLDGKVVLIHDIHPTSVTATEEIVPWLKSKGYQMVTVSELLAYKYRKDPGLLAHYDYGYFNLK